LNQRHQRGYPALVVRSVLKVRKDQFLEGVDLVLEVHEIGDCFVAINVSISGEKPVETAGDLPFIRIIDRLQADILLILE
jgi:hypothetical protein